MGRSRRCPMLSSSKVANASDLEHERIGDWASLTPVDQIQLSIHHAREALRLLPSDQVALYHLIQALRKSARQQELPQLVRRLSELRQETRDNEALQNRYKIFETQPGN